MTQRFLTLGGVMVVGVALLTAAAVVYFSTSKGDSLYFDQVEVDLSGVVVEQDRDVVFHYENRSRKAMRILGAAGCCGSNGCLSPRYEQMPHALPPGRGELSLSLHVQKAGQFRCQALLWVDDHGTREIVFTVHGTAQDPTSESKEVTKP